MDIDREITMRYKPKQTNDIRLVCGTGKTCNIVHGMANNLSTNYPRTMLQMMIADCIAQLIICYAQMIKTSDNTHK